MARNMIMYNIARSDHQDLDEAEGFCINLILLISSLIIWLLSTHHSPNNYIHGHKILI